MPRRPHDFDAEDIPHGCTHWARRWHVHPNTARKLLKRLHQKYGTSVVWIVGAQHRYVASHASLAVVGEARRTRSYTVGRTPHRGEDKTQVSEDLVTRDDLAHALAALWKEIRQIQAQMRIAPSVPRQPFLDGRSPGHPPPKRT